MKIEDALQSGKSTTLSCSRITISDMPAAKLAFLRVEAKPVSRPRARVRV